MVCLAEPLAHSLAHPPPLSLSLSLSLARRALDTLLPHADSGYFEPWLGGSFRDAAGKLNASKATGALLKMINHSTALPDKGVTFRSSPAGDVPSSGGGVDWIHHADPAVLRANATKKLGFPLASFLCAANAHWKLCYAYSCKDLDTLLTRNPHLSLPCSR